MTSTSVKATTGRVATVKTSSVVLPLLCLLGALSSGCALLGKGKPLQLRYFDLSAAPTVEPAAKTAAPRLRLGTVSASRHIDRRFVSRRSAHELSYYEQWRWTDPPDAFLRRTLSQNLFEQAGLTRVVSGVAPTLEVELSSFEEVRAEGRQRARAVLLAVLHDDRVQLWQRTFEAETEVGGGDAAEALAAALGVALRKVCAQLTEQTLAALPASPAAAPDPALATPTAQPE